MPAASSSAEGGGMGQQQWVCSVAELRQQLTSTWNGMVFVEAGLSTWSPVHSSGVQGASTEQITAYSVDVEATTDNDRMSEASTSSSDDETFESITGCDFPDFGALDAHDELSVAAQLVNLSSHQMDSRQHNEVGCAAGLQCSQASPSGAHTMRCTSYIHVEPCADEDMRDRQRLAVKWARQLAWENSSHAHSPHHTIAVPTKSCLRERSQNFPYADEAMQLEQFSLRSLGRRSIQPRSKTGRVLGQKRQRVSTDSKSWSM